MADTLTRGEIGPGGSSVEQKIPPRQPRIWKRITAIGTLAAAVVAGGAAVATDGFRDWREPGASASTTDNGHEEGGNTDNIPVVDQTDPTRIEQAINNNTQLREALARFAGSEVASTFSEDLTAERATAASTMITFADGSIVLVSADAVGLEEGGGSGLSRSDIEAEMEANPGIWDNPERGPGGNTDAFYQAGRIESLPGHVQVVGFTEAGTPFFMQAQLKSLESVTDYGLRLGQLEAATAALYGSGVFGR